MIIPAKLEVGSLCIEDFCYLESRLLGLDRGG